MAASAINYDKYRSKVVATAKSYIGTKEPNGDDQFIKAYNNEVGTTFSMSVAWCAIFVSFVMKQAGVPRALVPAFAACNVARETIFKPRGIWREPGSYTPQPGDIILFDWDPDNHADHVGIVTKVSGGKVYTVEGNSSNMVREKSYSLTSKYIDGYAVPGAVQQATAVGNKVTNDSKTDMVKNFQSWLNDTYAAGLTIDGSCGPATKTAAIRAWQKQMNTSYKCRLEVDGSYGPACREAADKHPTTQTKNVAKLVFILQGLLYAHGYNCKGFDGSFGPGCLAAVKGFQKARKLDPDGSVGPDTWGSLFNIW